MPESKSVVRLSDSSIHSCAVMFVVLLFLGYVESFGV